MKQGWGRGREREEREERGRRTNNGKKENLSGAFSVRSVLDHLQEQQI